MQSKVNNLVKLNLKKIPTNKWGKNIKQKLWICNWQSKKLVWQINSWKICWTSLTTSEISVKSMRYYFTLRPANITDWKYQTFLKTRVNYYTFLVEVPEKAMAPHSSTLGLENPRDGGAWWAAVHGVTKSQTRLRDFPFTFHFHALEKEMATHSSVLAWRILGMREPDGLPSMGSHRVGHDWSDLAAAAAAAVEIHTGIITLKAILEPRKLKVSKFSNQ